MDINKQNNNFGTFSFKKQETIFILY